MNFLSALSRTNGIPLYIQIREVLRDQIAQGELKPGQKIPAEDEVAAQFGVSRMTVRKAIIDLIEARLLYRRLGLGTFVAHSQVERDHTRLTSFFDSCRAKGSQPAAEILRREVIPASPRVATALGLDEGESMIRIETLRSVDGTPVTLHDAQMPLKHFPQLPEADLEDLHLESQHVWELIERCGFRISHVAERLEARSANEYLERLLRVEAGAPILYGEGILYTDDGMPIKYAHCYNRGDTFSLTIELVR